MQSYQRPRTLYRYGERAVLERALTAGEFRLLPADGFLTLSFCTAWQPNRIALFGGDDACLVIHNTEEFGERVHRAVQRALPDWMGIDGIVSYGSRSPLGAIFSKPLLNRAEKEWLFAWRSMQGGGSAVVIRLGSIEEFAEIKGVDDRTN
jgi:hypothetical protein